MSHQAEDLEAEVLDERDDSDSGISSSSSSGRRWGSPPVVQDADAGVAPEAKERGGSHAQEEEACNSDVGEGKTWLVLFFWGGVRKCKGIIIYMEGERR